MYSKKLMIYIGLLSACLFFSSTFVLGQAPDSSAVQQQYRISISKLFSLQLFIAYERQVFKKITTGFELGLLKKAFYSETLNRESYEQKEIITDQTTFFGVLPLTGRTKAKYGIQANWVNRLYQRSLFNGPFLETKIGYQYVDFGNLTVEHRGFLSIKKDLNGVQQSSFIMGVSIGWRYRIKKRALLEWYLYVGYLHSKIHNKERFEANTSAQRRDEIQVFYDHHLMCLNRRRIEFGVNFGFSK